MRPGTRWTHSPSGIHSSNLAGRTNLRFVALHWSGWPSIHSSKGTSCHWEEKGEQTEPGLPAATFPSRSGRFLGSRNGFFEIEHTIVSPSIHLVGRTVSTL